MTRSVQQKFPQTMNSGMTLDISDYYLHRLTSNGDRDKTFFRCKIKLFNILKLMFPLKLKITNLTSRSLRSITVT